MAGFKIRSQLKMNLQQFVDSVLLQDGYFFNVFQGDIDANGDSPSVLTVDNSDQTLQRYALNQVFQSPFHNWVYESGVSVPSGFAIPTVASGIYVDGIFKTRTDATYGHSIDYPNGRIVMDTPITGSEVIESDFSYKQYHVQAGDRNDIQYFDSSIESRLKDNPTASGILSNPSVSDIVMPAIMMSITDSEYSPLALGSTGKIGLFEITFYVFAKGEDYADDIIDLITQLEDHPFALVNMNTTPFPLDFDGDVESGYVPYFTLQSSHLLYKGHWRNADGTSPIPITPSTTYVFTAEIELEMPDI